MNLKPIKNRKHLIRLLSFLWLLVCLTQQSNAATESMAGTNEQEPLSTKQVIKNQESPKQKASVSFQQVETIPALLQSGKLELDDIPNPHWNKNGCIACHTSTAATGTMADAKNLRHKEVEQICYYCHSPAFSHRYIHPSDVRPDKKMQARMSQVMRAEMVKSNNIINCSSCHDMTLQCQSGVKHQKSTNPKFFRNGPYESRSQLCFLCHDKSQYQRLNPHEQINQQGKLQPEKCRICHADSIEELDRITDIDQLQFNARGSLSTMCWGCHPWTPHPGGQFSFFKNELGPTHLVKPPKKIKQRLDKMSEKNQIYFPLEPDSGKVFCGTCHNAHEKGVIKNPEKAKGAGSKKRLRDQKICDYCHLI